MLMETFRSDLIDAMRSKDSLRKGVLQLLINGVQKAEKIKKDDLTEEEILSVISRELKQANETLEAAEKAKREDMISETKRRISLLEAYLPKQLTEDEIYAFVEGKISELGLDTSDKGNLMKNLMPYLKGKADGKLASKVISSFAK